ncbi:hypothetical protein EVAR_51975_1 [Eumeta japonica]|uniref:Uncharacterized protein n=1 Tax=Eumeta variegata TaxID=151549 RepID=A0A4C1Y4Q7_EUMVA|nr:hypothetical protein EVAR_51975_1 [Eumeta japonica]
MDSSTRPHFLSRDEPASLSIEARTQRRKKSSLHNFLHSAMANGEHGRRRAAPRPDSLLIGAGDEDAEKPKRPPVAGGAVVRCFISGQQ